MILIGLVGTPASGKSTVAEQLQSKGALWINADLVARDVLQLPHVIQQLADHFGEGIVGADGLIERATLAGLVFGSTPRHRIALDYLESIVHPPTRLEIADRLRRAFKESVQFAILDVPLLFESNWHLACDSIWCVDAPRRARVQWSASRGWDGDELDRRESNQLAIVDKQRLSNVILQNDTTLADLHRIVDEQWANLATMNASRADLSDDSHCFADGR